MVVFFDRNQVTVHPMMCYYKENLGDKVNHAIIGINEEIKLDADLAIAFENRPLESVKNERGHISVLESRQQWYEITSKHFMAIMYVTAWVPQYIVI